MSEERFLLVKRGLYYAPDRQGYTGVKAKAGRYREVDGLGLEGVTVVHEDNAPDFSEACWPETKIAALEAELAAKDATIREQAMQYLATEGQAIDAMDKIAALKSAGDALLPYTRHLQDCAIHSGITEVDCACSYLEAFQHWREVSGDA